MKTPLTLGIVAIWAAGVLSSSCCAASRPIVLVFEAKQGEGASPALAAAATRAVRDYLRESQRVEATVFDRESPSVARAIQEKKLTPDQVASYSSEQERTSVAGVLLFDYACGSEVSVEDKTVTVKMWVAKVGGAKSERWDATGTASSSGTAANDQNNAMQSATSSAVNSIDRRAFADLPRVAQPSPSSGAETTALNADQAPKQDKPTSDAYVVEAERNLKAGNIALAIQQYSKAVDVDPSNASLRLKLAAAYAARGMYEEAENELVRAERNGASAESLQTARDNIKKQRGGDPVAAVEPEPASTGAAEEPVDSVVVSGGNQSVARIIEGDKLWREGKPDEAAEAYKASVKLNPAEWRAWERLAVVNASMSLFGESRKALENLKTVRPNPDAKEAAVRYEMLRKAFDTNFAALIDHYDTRSASFAAGRITRETYYADAKGLAMRLESMAKFLEVLEVPIVKQPANNRRNVACGLMAQAASSLTEYLESNDKTARDNAATFAAAAHSQLKEAEKLESNTITVTE